jgi:hypothetical protein
MLSSGELGLRNERTNALFHVVRDARGLLDARPGLGAQVQMNRARVDGREEVLTQKRYQHCGAGAHTQKSDA